VDILKGIGGYKKINLIDAEKISKYSYEVITDRFYYSIQ
jgi:hypothetical protein